MKTLTKTQILYIDNDLKAKGLSDGFRNELLDHVCCLVEQQIQSGKTFSEAYAFSLETFGDQGFAELKQIRKPAQRTLPRKMITSIAACILLMVVVVDAQDRPDMHPISKDCKVSSHFGKRKDPFTKEMKWHQGMDFPVPVGTPIRSTATGIVKLVEMKDSGHGNNIIIDHGDGFETRYANLSELKVEKGQKVKKGEVIALSGNSGRSTAPHLHYEVIRNGEHVDPINYMIAK